MPRTATRHRPIFEQLNDYVITNLSSSPIEIVMKYQGHSEEGTFHAGGSVTVTVDGSNDVVRYYSANDWFTAFLTRKKIQSANESGQALRPNLAGVMRLKLSNGEFSVKKILSQPPPPRPAAAPPAPSLSAGAGPSRQAPVRDDQFLTLIKARFYTNAQAYNIKITYNGIEERGTFDPTSGIITVVDTAIGTTHSDGTVETHKSEYTYVRPRDWWVDFGRRKLGTEDPKLLPRGRSTAFMRVNGERVENDFTKYEKSKNPPPPPAVEEEPVEEEPVEEDTLMIPANANDDLEDDDIDVRGRGNMRVIDDKEEAPATAWYLVPMGAVTLAALSISPEPLDNDAFSTFMNTYFHPGREVSVALVDTFAIHSTDERVVEFAYVFGILPVKTYSMVDTDGNFSAEYDDLSNAVSHSVLSWEKWSFSPQNKTVTIHGVSYTVSIPEPEMLSEAGFMVACVPPGTPHGTTMHPDATRAMYVPMQVPVKADDSNLVGYDGTFFYPGGNGNARLLGYIMKKPPEHAQNAECPEPMILYNQGYRSSVLRVFRRR